MLPAWVSPSELPVGLPIALIRPDTMRISVLLGITFASLPFVLRADQRRKGTGSWCYDSQDPKCGCTGIHKDQTGERWKLLAGFTILDDQSLETKPCQDWLREFGPLHWKEIMPTCGGENQSPINIDRRKAQRNKDLDELLFEGYDQAPPGRWRLLNDGHTVIMNLDGASAAEQINVTKGGLQDTYRALQFHFHWGDINKNGSEHTIDGIQYPMELHLVHMNAKYKTLSEAKGHPNGLAVLSFLFKVSDADNTNYNTIVAGLKNISQADDYVDLASTFSLSNLLPNMALLSKYYRYKGSLTTPSCDEVVTWTVFEEQIPISKPQLNAFVNTLHFRKVGTMSLKMTNNFRPVQPLHSRKVFASKDATISCCSPLAASLFFPLFLAFLAGQFSWPS